MGFGFLASPFARYGLAALILSIIVAGAIWYTYNAGQSAAEAVCEAEKAEYILQKKELQEKIDQQQRELNEKVTVEYVDRIITQKEIQYVTKEVAVNTVPDRVELSNGWVSTHDASARGHLPDAARSADASPSGVKANQALGVVVDNYGTCQQIRTQLITLQDWILETDEQVEEANREASK